MTDAASNPVQRTPLGLWAVFGYDDAVRLLRDPTLSVDDRAVIGPNGNRNRVRSFHGLIIPLEERPMRHHFLSFVATIALVTAVPALAAEIETSSQIDAVAVYPDGATVTRLIRLDLPAGDSTLFARDFPLTLDPSSLRVEGDGGSRIVIGAVDARPPLPTPPANLPQVDRQLEALRDQRAGLDGEIAAATARRK